MRRQFSKSWKSSKQPRKQRKFRFNAPLHIKSKMIASHLSKELRQEYNKRSISVRKGDKVKIMRGSFEGKIGKIERVDRKEMKVYVEKIEFTKKDGSKAFVPLDPSNILVIEISDDKKRLKRMKVK
jgi:large subunit ribosomal protein L24